MFSRINTFFIIAVGYFVIASGEFHKCKIGDVKCLKEVGTELLVEAKGFSDINLISLDPMNFGDMRIQKDEKSPVNIDLKMKNAQAFGLAGTKIIKASGFGKDLKGPHSLTFHNDATSLVGDYDINGK
uniref:Uncharacterized protein n=1 Tax=Megaselia scalaris TaxID=36166 RepID=T1GD30_MEGSC